MAKEFDFWRGLPGQAGLFFDKNNPAGRHKTARFGDQAPTFIRSNDLSRPFCLSISFNAPHARDRQPREWESQDWGRLLSAAFAADGERLRRFGGAGPEPDKASHAASPSVDYVLKGEPSTDFCRSCPRSHSSSTLNLFAIRESRI